MSTFKELGLCSELLQAIEEQGYEHPMPVQEAVIPFLLNKEESADLVALAQTGTGKTAAYGLPLLHLLSDEGLPIEGKGSPSAVILSPTRELCIQISDDMEGFGKYLPNLTILPVYGGANIEPQIRALKAGVDVIVATPGRLVDLMKRGAADLSQIQYVVLDEADEMLSMGFQEELDAILEGVPEGHRTLLFSATMSKEIERIAQNYLKEKREIQVGSRNEGAEHVNHIYYMVHAKDKYLALKRLVDFYPRIYAIIFCRTRMETQEVADNLIRDGYNADALHGDLSQQQRDLTMQKFRKHRTQLLVATDVAARGLDVDDLTHVINYGMPDDVENYTHRSGRTGRAGKKGTSLCIINLRERGRIRQVEKVIQKQFEKGTLPEPREICSKQLYHVIDDIERVEVDEEEIAPFMDEVQRRWAWLDKDDLIKRVLSREFGRFLQYYANAPEIEAVSGSEKGEKGSRKKSDHTPEEGYTRLFLNVGKIDKMYAREIMGLINTNVKGDKVEIGRIDLMKSFAFVEVKNEDADRVIKAMKHGVTIKGRSVVVDRSEPAGKGKASPAPSKRGEKNSKIQNSKFKKDKRVKEEKSTSKRDEKNTKKFDKSDWMQFLHPEEGWARRRPKKK
ncbi:MAG: DEAD/DEAH box helicase [Bacteroidaceae bacterium]|nr:DEAD/DEAH box helicase [Bacteroidaceae bacterium]